MAVSVDTKTGLKIFNTRAAKASEKITGTGYAIIEDEALKTLPPAPAGAIFNAEEQARLKKLIDEGMQVTYEMETLREGLRDTVKAIAEEMDLKPGIINKAIKIAHKASFQDEYDKFDELETILETVGRTL